MAAVLSGWRLYETLANFTESGSGRVLLRVRNAETEGMTMEIIDHGPGFLPAFNPQTDGGFGFRLLRALAEQIGAAAVFQSSGRGVRFRLVLPSAPKAPASTLGDLRLTLR